GGGRAGEPAGAEPRGQLGPEGDPARGVRADRAGGTRPRPREHRDAPRRDRPAEKADAPALAPQSPGHAAAPDRAARTADDAPPVAQQASGAASGNRPVARTAGAARLQLHRTGPVAGRARRPAPTHDPSPFG